MRLVTGTRVGSYEVLSPLGEGGMGEVYRARDLRLERDVALKILLAGVANDAERIAQGPLPIEEACRIAQQIAEALEAAHAQGVIHRDLKPANIKLTGDDKVKVLDFGLAKALDAMSGGGVQASGDISTSPTITSPAMTRIGVILGTAAYMAPEQVRGKSVDKRADIWAFGCVFYEMLTGRRLFAPASGGRAGRTAGRDAVDEVTDTLAAVLTKEPDLTVLPANTPSGLRRLLRRCLEKDRAHRLADIADARLEIEEALTSRADEASCEAVTKLGHWPGILHHMVFVLRIQVALQRRT